MIKTYRHAVKFLESFILVPKDRYLGQLAFDRMNYLVNLMDNPQFKYPSIHVGGTSGKGSTTTIIASILGTTLRVGSNTSPHLVEETERIKINDGDISKRDFTHLVNQLVPFIEKMRNATYGRPSIFELITAGAFLYFLRKKVDIAVLEVGLGGRFDATNVIKPHVCVLTNVGLDHTQVLGNTLEKIAREKIGIIKPGIAVVSGVRQSSVIRILNAKCKMQNAKLSLLGRDFGYKINEISEKGSVFDYFGKKTYRNLRISLLGVHQIENAAIALRTVECMNAQMREWRIDEEEIRSGLKKAFIPGRMEIIRRNPTVILDGAHNPDKMNVLVLSIQRIFPQKKVTLLIAIKNDKDAKTMLCTLLPICSEVFLTRFLLHGDVGEIGSHDPEYLEELIYRINSDLAVSVLPDLTDGYSQILRLANKDDIILVTGSLYLVGEVRKFLK